MANWINTGTKVIWIEVKEHVAQVYAGTLLSYSSDFSSGPTTLSGVANMAGNIQREGTDDLTGRTRQPIGGFRKDTPANREKVSAKAIRITAAIRQRLIDNGYLK